MSKAPKVLIGGGKLAANPDYFKAWRQGKNPGPLVVEAGIVNGCNHNCLHCDFQQFEPYGDRKGFIDADLFQTFLRDFAGMGGIEVFFAGSGEPLLHPKFADFVKLANELGLSCTLSSNGQMLNRKNAEKILPYLKWIRCSVNGGDAKTYAAIHRCGEKEFDRLARNLETAIRIRDAGGHEARISIQYILYDLNFDTIAGVVDLHERAGTDLLVFRNRLDKDGGKNRLPETVLRRLRRLEVERDRVEVRWNDFPDQPDLPTWSRCYGPNFRINLDASGNIIPCARDFYIPSKVGNINTDRFPDIWRSEKRRQVYRQITSGRDIPICGKWCQVAFDNIYVQGWLDSHPLEEIQHG